MLPYLSGSIVFGTLLGILGKPRFIQRHSQRPGISIKFLSLSSRIRVNKKISADLKQLPLSSIISLSIDGLPISVTVVQF